jgi:hypothetical protein
MPQRKTRPNCERYQEVRRKANGICNKKRKSGMRKRKKIRRRSKIRMSDERFIRQ